MSEFLRMPSGWRNAPFPARVNCSSKCGYKRRGDATIMPDTVLKIWE
ncbi:MAG: hypothetical protein H7095_01970 [Pseudopedobacter sp.]|nr:hypothetical protein [Deinococcales bacterium]